ncbi:hypothetical protein VPH35_009899 [Triticum aestivum]|uniref:putative FBD-associated F-box protein At5g22720 n=1 Tax=Triticum aestivum TaxID=4565 RepID=UPI001D00736F|nr:putative FBD-associated F-box protein At5g22720 [Triticum aestivum]
MEAAASAAVAAAKETALAAAAAASAASKEAAAAAAAATEAAATAKEAAAKASAAALNAKEAAAVATATGEAVAATVAAAMAALQASKKRKFHLVDDQDPPGSGNCDDVDGGIVDLTDDVDGGSVDHISRVPDAVLGTILSLLPTKEGARTQVISRRWRPLWRSAPLNLAVDGGPNSKELITKILSEHPGPARRFSVRIFQNDDKIEGWLSSKALDNLQEFELIYTFWGSNWEKLCLLPLSVFRFSPTLRVAKFCGSHFPRSNLIVQLSLKFPCLKQLTLEKVTISEDVLQSMLSGCPALECLELMMVFGIDRLCISSQTLKSLGFCAEWSIRGVTLHELVIEDAPCLERLLRFNPIGTKTIKIIGRTPKLAILGMLSEHISEFHLGSSVFQKMIAVSLTTKCTA